MWFLYDQFETCKNFQFRGEFHIFDSSVNLDCNCVFVWAPHVWVFVCVWPNEEDPRWCLGPLHICSLLKVSPIASTQCHQSPKFKPRSCVSLSLTQSLCHQSLTLRVTSRFPIQTEKHFYCVSHCCVVWCQTMKKVEAIYPPQIHLSRSAGLNVN